MEKPKFLSFRLPNGHNEFKEFMESLLIKDFQIFRESFISTKVIINILLPTVLRKKHKRRQSEKSIML